MSKDSPGIPNNANPGALLIGSRLGEFNQLHEGNDLGNKT